MSAQLSVLGLKRRYSVEYARPCGNTFFVCDGNGKPFEPFYSLRFAQALAELERKEHALRGWRSCVFITDLENPERGDVDQYDPDWYERGELELK